MTPYETDDESEPVDQHSGSRLVLLLFLIPLTAIAGIVAWSIVRQIAVEPLGYVAAQRAGYVAAGVAMAVTVLAILRWQSALSPKAQSLAEEPIDEMSEDDDL